MFYIGCNRNYRFKSCLYHKFNGIFINFNNINMSFTNIIYFTIYDITQNTIGRCGAR